MAKSIRHKTEVIWTCSQRNEEDINKLKKKTVHIQAHEFNKRSNINTLLEPTEFSSIYEASYEFIFEDFPEDFMKFVTVHPIAYTENAYDLQTASWEIGETLFYWIFKPKWKKVGNNFHLKVYILARLLKKEPHPLGVTTSIVPVYVKIAAKIYNRRVWHEIQHNST